MLATQVWIVGLLAGAYYIVFSFGSMIVKLSKYLIWSDELQKRRTLAMVYLTLLLVAVPTGLLSVPLPGQSRACGIVESRNLSIVHADQAGFVMDVFAKTGDMVTRGQSLCKLKNDLTSGELMLKRATLDGQIREFRHHRNRDVVMNAKTSKEIAQTKFELAKMGTLQSLNEIGAPAEGTLIGGEQSLKVGQHVEPGDEVFRIASGGWLVHAIVNASTFASIHPEVGQRVDCRLIADHNSFYSGKITKISASGDKVVPYKALTHLAGGMIPVDPSSMEATEPFFEITIELAEIPSRTTLRNGLVCEIRLESNNNTLGRQLYRSALRFLNQIDLNQ